MFTLTMVLGITTRSGRAALGLSRFGVADLHKTASLTGTGAGRGARDAPCCSTRTRSCGWSTWSSRSSAAYRPLWLGLGTLAIDVLVVIVASSLLRHRIGPRVFRARALAGLRAVAGRLRCTPSAPAPTPAPGGSAPSRSAAPLAVGRRRSAGAPRSRSPSAATPASPRRSTPRKVVDPMTIATEIAAPVGTRRLLRRARVPRWPSTSHTFGPLPEHVDLPDLVERAGLLGRGGAGFPSARKLRAVAARGHGGGRRQRRRGRAGQRQGPHAAARPRRTW